MSHNLRHFLYSMLFALPLIIGLAPAAYADTALVFMGCATSQASPDQPRVTYFQTTVEGSIPLPDVTVGDPCSDALMSVLRPGQGFDFGFLRNDQFFVAPPGIAVMMYQITISPFE